MPLKTHDFSNISEILYSVCLYIPYQDLLSASAANIVCRICLESGVLQFLCQNGTEGLPGVFVLSVGQISAEGVGGYTPRILIGCGICAGPLEDNAIRHDSARN